MGGGVGVGSGTSRGDLGVASASEVRTIGTVPDPRPTSSHSPRIRAAASGRTRLPGLDGLRALAAILVLVYHLVPGGAPSGFIGVDAFFVLSGFLITSLLVDEVTTSGRLDLRAFWVRRFRRLVPAVATVSILSSAAALMLGGDALVALPRQVLGALSGSYNWLEIAAGSSYFDESSPLLLTNMWSLALEQQFYLVWPLVLLLLRLAPKRRIGACLALASALAFALLGPDALSRAYMGTDSHLWGLMIGAALAFAVPHALRAGERREPRALEWGIAGIGGLLLLVGLALIPPIPRSGPTVMLLASLATALVVRALVPDVSRTGPARLLARLLDAPALRWLGERSYGIYLWHWPLWVLAFYAAPLADPLPVAAVVAPASICLAGASYRFVETPIRREGLLPWARRLRERLRGLDAPRRLAALAVPGLVLALAAWAMAVAPARSSAALAVEEGSSGVLTRIGADAPASGRMSGEGAESAGAETPESEGARALGAAHGAPRPPRADSAESALPPLEEGAPAISGDRITLIGDSVSLCASAGLSEALPGIAIDAEVSRSIQAAPSIIDGLAASGALREIVVVSLATNGIITDEEIDDLVDRIGAERELVLVTGFGPARCTWIPPANDAIRRAPSRHRHVLVADWNALIAGRTDLLADDLVHPAGPEGVGLYVEAIERALADAGR